MRNEINFSYNWNNKLTGKYFTTLRLKDENRFIIGEIYSILLNKRHIAYGEIIAVKHLFLREINEYIAGLDTGYSAEECRKMIMKMYSKSNVDFDKRMLCLVLFRKWRSNSEKSKNQQHSEEISA